MSDKGRRAMEREDAQRRPAARADTPTDVGLVGE
jgi:hypothetical protein